MAETWIELQVIEGLALPYEAGAEQALDGELFDGWLFDEWQALIAAYPGLTLQPLFSTEPWVMADIDDAIRMTGFEPPNLFEWFTVSCAENLVDSILPLVQALPFVELAYVAPVHVPAGTVSLGTNDEAQHGLQVRPSPQSTDAIYGWQVPGGTGQGVTIYDLEYGWNLGHEDLIDAGIHRLHPQTTTNQARIDHGTGMAGIVIARDNGIGIVGVAPRANLIAVPNGGSTADVVNLALSHASPGDIVLLELAEAYPKPPPGASGGPDIPVEATPLVQLAIRKAALFGITVVEPAGNAGLKLDQLPFPHILAFDSMAIMVGGGQVWSESPFEWTRDMTYGARVDCFAPGERAQMPIGSYEYARAEGTSVASAVIAGLVAQIQGMCMAATDPPDVLHPLDIRRMLRDPDLGVPTNPPDNGIGRMPDLRRICRTRRWAPIMPVGMVATSADSFAVAYLDRNLRLVRRQWSFFGGWTLLPAWSKDDEFDIRMPQQLALTSAVVGTAAPRIVTDAVGNHGNGSVHYKWWDSEGYEGLWWPAAAPAGTFAGGRDLAAVRVTPSRLAVIGVNPAGRLTCLVGDLDTYVVNGFDAPDVIDTTTRYRRPGDPVVCSRASHLLDVVAINEAGLLVWYRGEATPVGINWSAPTFDETAVKLAPTARPAVVVLPDRREVLAVGGDGKLRSIGLDTVTDTMFGPVVVDANTNVSTEGPVALVRQGDRLVALAVSSGNRLCAAHRDRGGTWSALEPVDDHTAAQPMGGVTAVAMSALGIAAIFVTPTGHIRWTMSRNGEEWSPPAAIELEFPIP